MACMCGATDCPSCGPAQGYEIVRGAFGRRVNPEPDWASELEHFGIEDLRTAIVVLEQAASAAELVSEAAETLQRVGL